MIHLLDSNVWIALIRRSSVEVAAKFQSVAVTSDIRICSVVLAELWYGCARSAKPQSNRRSLEALIAPFPSLPFDDAAADRFASIRRELEINGQTIGPFDLQIAAIALTHGCCLVTHNVNEFRRVHGLLIADWQTS